MYLPCYLFQELDALTVDVVVVADSSGSVDVTSALQTDVRAMTYRLQSRLSPIGVFVSALSVQVSF